MGSRRNFLRLMLVIPALSFAQVQINKIPQFNLMLDLDGLRIERHPNGSYIYGSSCDDLKKDVTSLVQWKKRLESIGVAPAKPEPPTDIRCQKIGAEYRIKADSFLIDWVSLGQDRCPAFKGPNCWNSVLWLSGLIPNIRYSDDDEMHFWMRSPLCHRLEANEKPIPGDVIAIRSVDGREIHGFIYLNEHLAFSKNGSSALSPYGLKGLNSVFNTYGVPLNCRKVGIKARSLCNPRPDYLHCQSLSEYFAGKPELLKKFACLEQNVAKVENAITHTVMTGSPPPSCGSIDELQALLCKADTEGVLKCDFKNVPEGRMLQKSYEHRENGIGIQMNLIKQNQRGN